MKARRWTAVLAALVILALSLAGCSMKPAQGAISDGDMDALAHTVFQAFQSRTAAPILERVHPSHLADFAQVQDNMDQRADYVIAGESEWTLQERKVTARNGETLDQAQYEVKVAAEVYRVGVVHLTNEAGRGLFSYQIVKQSDYLGATQADRSYLWIGHVLTALCWGAMIAAVGLLARSDWRWKPLWTAIILFAAPGFKFAFREGQWLTALQPLTCGWSEWKVFDTYTNIQIALPVGVIIFFILYLARYRRKRMFVQQNLEDGQ